MKGYNETNYAIHCRDILLSDGLIIHPLNDWAQVYTFCAPSIPAPLDAKRHPNVNVKLSDLLTLFCKKLKSVISL